MAAEHSQQSSAIAIIVVFGVLGIVFILLRLCSRMVASGRLFLDDWLIIGAGVFSTGQIVTGYYYIKANHIGIHYADIPPQTTEQVKMGAVWNYANQLLYNPILSFVKVSVLCFLLRLGSHARIVNLMIWGTLYFTIALAIATLLTDAFQCTPVQYFWDTTIAGGHCIEQRDFYVATAVMTLFTDLLVLSIPVIIIAGLQMPFRRKMAVCGVLCIGLAATGVSAWRLDQLIVLYWPTSPSTDPTYGIGFVSSPVEVNVAIISACCPALKSLISRVAPRFLGSSGHGTYGGKSSTNGRYGRGTYIRSHADQNDTYELGQQNYTSNQHTQISSSHHREPGQRFPRSKTAESLSLSDDDGVIAGVMGRGISIMKTTNVTVQREPRSESLEKASSIDSLV